MTLLAVAFLVAQGVSAPAAILMPRVAGPWWTIARNPDLGPDSGENQVSANFSVFQAADGTWQLWAHLVGTKRGEKGRLLYRWEGTRLTDPDWKPMGITMEADTHFGETSGGLQSPFVLKHRDQFYMFYGDWHHICLARSWDGKTFARVLNADGRSGMFGEGDQGNTRDAVVLPVGNTFYLYYTFSTPERAVVFARTSNDLNTWSAPTAVAAGGAAGSGSGSADGPHILYHPEERQFYFFRTHPSTGPEEYMTSIYRSPNPLDFGVDDDKYRVGSLPLEVVRIVRHEGEYFIVSPLSGLQGYRAARLEWVREAR
jgi:hypothetical protein